MRNGAVGAIFGVASTLADPGAFRAGVTPWTINRLRGFGGFCISWHGRLAHVPAGKCAWARRPCHVLQLVLFDLPIKRPLADAEDLRGLLAISAHTLQRFLDQLF